MTDFALRRRMMVDTQVRPSDVTEYPIIEAMLTLPREDFVPSALREAAYLGEHLPIDAQRVILDPRTLAKMVDALGVRPTDLVLDIGTGFGYSTAVLANLAQAVVAVEPSEPLAREAEAALAQNGIDNAALHVGTMVEGAPQHGPYDAICLQGAVESIPDALIDQLADGGRIVAPFLEGRLGVVRVGLKIDGAVSWRYVFNADAPVLPGFGRVSEFQL